MYPVSGCVYYGSSDLKSSFEKTLNMHGDLENPFIWGHFAIFSTKYSSDLPELEHVHVLNRSQQEQNERIFNLNI